MYKTERRVKNRNTPRKEQILSTFTNTSNHHHLPRLPLPAHTNLRFDRSKSREKDDREN